MSVEFSLLFALVFAPGLLLSIQLAEATNNYAAAVFSSMAAASAGAHVLNTTGDQTKATTAAKAVVSANLPLFNASATVVPTVTFNGNLVSVEVKSTAPSIVGMSDLVADVQATD